MTYELPGSLLRKINTRPIIMPWQAGDGRCQACHAENPVWFVDSPLWNAVMDDEGGVLCPTCFMQVGEFRDLVDPNVIWKLVPQSKRR